MHGGGKLLQPTLLLVQVKDERSVDMVTDKHSSWVYKVVDVVTDKHLS
jgi:hypothetical protein